MAIAIPLRRMDFGRIVFLPIFILLAIPVFQRTYDLGGTLMQWSSAGLITLAHSTLLSAFYLLIIALYVLRSEPVATCRSWMPRLMALTGTFLPMAFVLLPPPTAYNYRLIAVGNGVMLIGLVCSVYALATLGRSFSIIPQSRSLVQSGPYRWVRHPLYVAEELATIGFFLAQPTWPRLGLLLVHAAFQIYRALQEEKVLAETFPEYAEYTGRTPRFLPRLLGPSDR